MKNPTILKGELSLLRADKSAVLTELRRSSKELKESREEINKLDLQHKGVRADIIDEVARLEKLTSRAIFVSNEITTLNQEIKNRENQNDITNRKNTQEVKLFLGRIQQLTVNEADVISEIGRLKNLFDNNSQVYNKQESARLARLRTLESDIKSAETASQKITKELEDKVEQEKKITKDRLKREDKLRLKEKNLDGRELSLNKREEDLITMSKDMTIVYGRLRELHKEAGSAANLDKLILQAL